MEPNEEQQRDHDVHRGSGKRHPQLLYGFVRHPFQPGEPSDGEQCDVTGPDPVATRRQGMAELVKHDASKERQNESDTLDDGLDTVTLVPVNERDPRDHHHERGVHVDIDAGDPGQFP